MAVRRETPVRREPEVIDPPTSKLTKYRANLAIDKDKINEEVCNHPEVFEHVAEQLALVTARHDTAKYELELTEAREAKRIREEALVEERKLTEGGLRELVILAEKVQDKQRALIEAKSQVGEWAALKESFQQRSYMLKECVAVYLSRMYASSSVTGPRDTLADGIRERTGQLREEHGYRPKRGSQ